MYVGSPVLARGETALSPRLQSKQYLWAMVITGKFNSMLMPHCARLGEVRLRLCGWSDGGAGPGQEGWRLLPGLSRPPSASEGPAVLVAGRASVVVGFLLWPPPPAQETLVPEESAWVGGGAPEEQRGF